MVALDWQVTFDDVLRRRLAVHGYVESLNVELVLASCGIDSLALVTLILELEGELGVEVPEDLMVIENFSTVGGLRSTFSQVVMAGAVLDDV